MPRFTPVAPAPPPPPPKTAKPVSAGEEDWATIGTTRNGKPGLAALGWILVLAGCLLFVATYYWASTYGAMFSPAGIRGDYVAALLIVVGIILGILFLFLPVARPDGLQEEATEAEVEATVRATQGHVFLSQIFVAVGLALVVIGLAWMAYWLRDSYLAEAQARTILLGIEAPSYLFGAPLVHVGAFLGLFFLGRLSASRRARNASALLLLRLRDAANVALAAGGFRGVSEAELRALLARIDGLMSQLPDAAVTEFSRSKEADTYLKLLEG